MKPTKQTRFPGWRTMTAAQRYNARMDAIWDDARKRGALGTWIIETSDESELNAKMYWSNDLGWVDRASATTFTDRERESLNLPAAGRWIKIISR